MKNQTGLYFRYDEIQCLIQVQKVTPKLHFHLKVCQNLYSKGQVLWSLILFLYLTHQKVYSAKVHKVQFRDWKHKSQQMEKPKLLFSIQISLTGCILAVLILLC